MTKLKNLGRWLFILPFAAFGVLHFGPLEFSLPYIPSFLPFPAAWVYFTGVCLMAFTLSAAFKKLDGLAALMLGIMMCCFVVMIHLPGALGGDFMKIIALFRDLTMAGAAFIYASTIAVDKRFVRFVDSGKASTEGFLSSH